MIKNSQQYLGEFKLNWFMYSNQNIYFEFFMITTLANHYQCIFFLTISLMMMFIHSKHITPLNTVSIFLKVTIYFIRDRVILEIE